MRFYNSWILFLKYNKIYKIKIKIIIMSGTLSLQIIKAELVRDIEVMGKMDPYCKLKIG